MSLVSLMAFNADHERMGVVCSPIVKVVPMWSSPAITQAQASGPNGQAKESR